MKIGEIITGKISSIRHYGVFIKFDDTFGLCHISNISDKFIKDLSSLYHIGQEVKAKIIQIDENNKVGLSIKDIEQEPLQKKPETIKKPSNYKSNINTNTHKPKSLDDMINHFLKYSDENIRTMNNRNKRRKRK